MDATPKRALSRAWAGGVVAALVLGAGLVAARMQPASATASESQIAGPRGSAATASTARKGATPDLGPVSWSPVQRVAPSTRPGPLPATIAPGRAKPPTTSAPSALHRVQPSRRPGIPARRPQRLLPLQVEPGPRQVLAYPTEYRAGARGFDISQYQCGHLPARPVPLAIVQITGGRINNPPNRCYRQEAAWAGLHLSAYIYMNGLPNPTPPESMTGPAASCAWTNSTCQAYDFGFDWARHWVAYSRGKGTILRCGGWMSRTTRGGRPRPSTMASSLVRWPGCAPRGSGSACTPLPISGRPLPDPSPTPECRCGPRAQETWPVPATPRPTTALLAVRASQGAA
jgi:hypothetical protein